MRRIEHTAGSARSLRSRWNRAFAVLFTVVILGALANFAGTRVLVGAYRSTADRIDEDATRLAALRADVRVHSRALGTAMDTFDQQSVAAADASVRAAFEAGIAQSDYAAGRQRLRDAFKEWQTPVNATDPLDHRTARVSALLDEAGAASRAGGRAVHDRASRVEKAGMVFAEPGPTVQHV